MAMWSYSLIYLVPISVLCGYSLGGWFTFLTPAVVFGLVPLLDIIIGKDYHNPDEADIQNLENRRGYRILTWICAPLQVLMILWSCRTVAAGNPSLLELSGLTISIGISSGIMGINVAHELAHRINGRFEPFLSKVMLATVIYMHWGLEHVVGHHRYVATPEDPATARLGESFYAFWPRTVFGSFYSAWAFEIDRLKRIGLPVFHWKNRVIMGSCFQLILLVWITGVLGITALIFFILQAFLAVTLLEIVNYIEHYGLMRKPLDKNHYEAVKPWHSWNSSNWLTNRFLFNLPRHSDHHYKPGRQYQSLPHFERARNCPQAMPEWYCWQPYPPYGDG